MDDDDALLPLIIGAVRPIRSPRATSSSRLSSSSLCSSSRSASSVRLPLSRLLAPQRRRRGPRSFDARVRRAAARDARESLRDDHSGNAAESRVGVNDASASLCVGGVNRNRVGFSSFSSVRACRNGGFSTRPCPSSSSSPPKSRSGVRPSFGEQRSQVS